MRMAKAFIVLMDRLGYSRYSGFRAVIGVPRLRDRWRARPLPA